MSIIFFYCSSVFLDHANRYFLAVTDYYRQNPPDFMVVLKFYMISGEDLYFYRCTWVAGKHVH